MSRVRSAIVALALALVVVGACGTAGTTRASDNRCRTDGDCPGAHCDPIVLACVSTDARATVVLSAAPADGRSTLAGTVTVFDPQPVATSTPLPLRLTAPRGLLGTVGAPGDTASIAVAATVRFHRQGAGPAEGTIVRTATPELRLAPSGHAYAYSVPLVPGLYDIAITPDDTTSFPPYYVQGFPVVADPAGTPLFFDVIYGSLGRLRGRIVDAANGTPFPGLNVQVVDTTTAHAPLSTRQPATTSDGAFQIFLSPGAPSAWQLEISSAEMSTSTLATARLVYRIDRTALGAISTAGEIADVALPHTAAFLQRTDTPCAPCVQFSAVVHGTFVDPSDPSIRVPRPLSAAAVDLQATDVLGALPAGHAAVYTAQLTSQVSGTPTIDVLPGTYVAYVTPPGGFPFAITRSVLHVDGNVLGAALDARSAVSWRVVVSDARNGRGVGGVDVEALPFSTPPDLFGLDRSDSRARRALATTDASGAAVLLVDAGTYRLVVRPNAASGFGAQVAVSRHVLWSAGDLNVADGVQLAPPVLARGRVVDSLGAALPGAVVRGFARVTDAATMLPTDVDLGSVFADDQGNYSLLLPSIAAP